jgi:thioredoxin:protein disulfide reductase
MSMPWLTDLTEARAEGVRWAQPVFALATVTWCPWCVRLDEETLADERVQSALVPFVCARLNGDENDQLPYEYDFDVYPTALIFGADGEYRGKVEGFHEPSEFLAELEELLSD